jgi:hypothetical protein
LILCENITVNMKNDIEAEVMRIYSFYIFQNWCLALLLKCTGKILCKWESKFTLKRPCLVSQTWSLFSVHTDTHKLPGVASNDITCKWKIKISCSWNFKVGHIQRKPDTWNWVHKTNGFIKKSLFKAGGHTNWNDCYATVVKHNWPKWFPTSSVSLESCVCSMLLVWGNLTS